MLQENEEEVEDAIKTNKNHNKFQMQRSQLELKEQTKEYGN